MRRLRGRVASLVLAATLLAACGSSDATPHPSTTKGGAAPTPQAGLAAGKAGLRSEIDRLEWPKAYTPTVEGLLPKLGDPKEILITKESGTAMANIWNLCAWLDEGTDRIEAGATAAQLAEAADAIDDWAVDDAEPAYYAEFAEGIRTGDPTRPNSFIEANGCRPFPS